MIAACLKAGYHVISAVRRQDAVEAISKGPSVQTSVSTGALSFAIIPDNAQSGAYREAVKGCTYIIHLASPLLTVPGDLVKLAVAGVRAVLGAAEITQTAERVVFTGSTSGLKHFERMLLGDPHNKAMLEGRSSEIPTFTADSRTPTPPPLPANAPAQQRYSNAKIACMNLIDDYVAANTPEASHFSIVNIIPGVVLGPDERIDSKAGAFKGSNLVFAWLFMPLKLNRFLGLSENDDAPLTGHVTHLNDVVEGHVKALDTERIPSKYQSFLFCCEPPAGPDLGDAADIVRKHLPEDVSEGRIPLAGHLGKSYIFFF